MSVFASNYLLTILYDPSWIWTEYVTSRIFIHIWCCGMLNVLSALSWYRVLVLIFRVNARCNWWNGASKIWYQIFNVTFLSVRPNKKKTNWTFKLVSFSNTKEMIDAGEKKKKKKLRNELRMCNNWLTNYSVCEPLFTIERVNCRKVVTAVPITTQGSTCGKTLAVSLTRLEFTPDCIHTWMYVHICT